MKYKKKFGQIFLINKEIINFIIEIINPKHNQNIVEIGSGLGAITIPIIKYLDLITLIEIDSYIINKFTKLLDINDKNKVILYNEDARFINFNKILRYKLDKIRIFGNLPYNDSILILINCINYINIIDDMHFMIQKELSDKIINKNSCRISVFIKIFFNVKLIYKCINPDSFYPKPKVNSSIIKMTPKYNTSYILKYYTTLEKMLKIIFINKRKIIKKNLNKLFNSKNIKLLNNMNLINFNLRPEDISIEQYIKLLFFYIEYELNNDFK